MKTTEHRQATDSFLRAQLTYVVDTGEKPVIYPSEPGGREERRTGQYQQHMVTIHDGRARADEFSLEREGFLLVDHATEVEDFYDEQQHQEVYDAEIRQLVKTLTGATEVVVFDHTLRADTAAVRAARVVREPAQMVHNDYTEQSAPRRLQDLLPADEAERRLESRYAIVNVWRPVRDPVRTSPLALCDARTITPQDLVVTERRARNRTGEIYQLQYNPAHLWYYFPKMERHEAAVFKCYDSAADGRPRFAAHAAFADPTSPSRDLVRESIESRTFAFF